MDERLRRLSAEVREAAGAARRLAPRGSGQWWEPPLDAVPLECAGLGADLEADVGDLVAGATAGCRLDEMDRTLRAQGAWLALDPPGAPSRTLGGVLAAGGGGPLAAGFGPPRDQVLGLTFVTGDGTVARTGGRVVKNVAGFDLAKILVGGHGGFGVIARAHLRLRAIPAADATRGWCGARAALAAATSELLAAAAMPAALEVVSPALAGALEVAENWTVLVRALGTSAGAEEELAAAALTLGARLGAVDVPQPVWLRWRSALGACPVVVRVGADPAAWSDAAALSAEHLGGDLRISVTVPRGTVRVGATAVSAASLLRLRAAAAARGWPLTLERADPITLRTVGLWGALDGEAQRLATALRATFDPAGIFAVPLFAR
jgi:glycolate oxidase FAD binding subunit